MSSDSTDPNTPSPDDKPAKKAAAKKTAAKKTAAKKTAAAKAASAKAASTKAGNATTEAAKATGKTEAVAAKAVGSTTEADDQNRQISISTKTLKEIGALVAAIAVIALLALGGWQWWKDSRTLAAFDQAKDASQHFVKTYFGSMMAADSTPESFSAAVVPLTTGEMRKRAEDEAKTGIDFFNEMKLQNGEVDVTGTMVESFSRTDARTVLAADIKGTSAVAPDGGQQPVLFQIDLVKEDGSWKVSNMGALPGVTAETQGEGGAPNPQPGPAEDQPAPAPAG